MLNLLAGCSGSCFRFVGDRLSSPRPIQNIPLCSPPVEFFPLDTLPEELAFPTDKLVLNRLRHEAADSGS